MSRASLLDDGPEEPEDLRGLLEHPRFRSIFRQGGAWNAYAATDDAASFRWGGGRTPDQALRMALGLDGEAGRRRML